MSAVRAILIAMTVADITTTSYRIGHLRIDATRVRGDGGAINPALVLPLSVELEPQPPERRIAVTEVRAELSLADGSPQTPVRLGDWVRIHGVGGTNGVWATTPQATSSYGAELNLLVRFEVEAACVREENPNVLGPSAGAAVDLLPSAFGLDPSLRLYRPGASIRMGRNLRRSVGPFDGGWIGDRPRRSCRGARPTPVSDGTRMMALVRFAVQLETAPNDMPPWLYALARQLNEGGTRAPDHILGPVTAVRELRAAAAAVMAGRGMVSKKDRASLCRDVGIALDRLGREARVAAEPYLGALRRDLGRLPALLAGTDGAIVLRSLCDAMLEGLTDRRLAVAGWRDAREVFESRGWAELCELRIRQLAELSTLQGHDWRGQASLACGVLLDHRLELAEIGRVPMSEGLMDVREPAGVDLLERLELVETVFLREPPTGDVVGWVCFANALLRDGSLEVDGVTLVGHQVWNSGSETLPSEDPTSVAHELRDARCSIFFRHLPAPPFVLMRVPLGLTGIGGAAERVRQIASDLVRVARWSTEWRLMPGTPVHVRSTHSGWFGTPIQEDDGLPLNRFSPEFEPTADALADLAEPLIDAVLSRRRPAHDAVMDVEWAQAVAAIPDAAQRIALGLRLIERGLARPTTDEWTAAVTRYLKCWWISDGALGRVSAAAHAITDTLDGPLPIEGVVEPWRGRLMPRSGATGYGVRLDETLRALPEALEAMPEGTMQHRVVAEVADRASGPETWLALYSELGQAFDVLLARAARQRNAVVHGADTVGATLASVDGFVAVLQAMVVRAELDAVAAGDELLTYLEGIRMRAERRRMRLKAGEALASVLFDQP